VTPDPTHRGTPQVQFSRVVVVYRDWAMRQNVFGKVHMLTVTEVLRCHKFYSLAVESDPNFFVNCRVPLPGPFELLPRWNRGMNSMDGDQVHDMMSAIIMFHWSPLIEKTTYDLDAPLKPEVTFSNVMGGATEDEIRDVCRDKIANGGLSLRLRYPVVRADFQDGGRLRTYAFMLNSIQPPARRVDGLDMATLRDDDIANLLSAPGKLIYL